MHGLPVRMLSPLAAAVLLITAPVADPAAEGLPRTTLSLPAGSSCPHQIRCEWDCPLYCSAPAGIAAAGHGQLWTGWGLSVAGFNGFALVDFGLADCPHSPILCATATPSRGDALAYDGRYFYQVERSTNLILKVDPVTCDVVASCPAPAPSGGLEWDGEHLWQVDAQFLYKLTPPPDGQVVASCPNPVGRAGALALCGQNLLLGDDYSNELITINPADCGIIRRCAFLTSLAGGVTLDMASDGQSSLYVTYVLPQPIPYGYTIALVSTELDCSAPTPTRIATWGTVKARYR